MKTVIDHVHWWMFKHGISRTREYELSFARVIDDILKRLKEKKA